MKKNNMGSERKFWLALVIITIVFSLPSWWRLVQLRPLYFSVAVRDQVGQAVQLLRVEKGIAGTDLNLYKIDRKSDRVSFYFHYYHHHHKGFKLIADYVVQCQKDICQVVG